MILWSSFRRWTQKFIIWLYSSVIISFVATLAYWLFALWLHTQTKVIMQTFTHHAGEILVPLYPTIPPMAWHLQWFCMLFLTEGVQQKRSWLLVVESKDLYAGAVYMQACKVFIVLGWFRSKKCLNPCIYIYTRCNVNFTDNYNNVRVYIIQKSIHPKYVVENKENCHTVFLVSWSIFTPTTASSLPLFSSPCMHIMRMPWYTALAYVTEPAVATSLCTLLRWEEHAENWPHSYNLQEQTPNYSLQSTIYLT